MLHDAPGTSVQDKLDETPELSLDQRLDDIQREVRDQGESIKKTSRGFSIFAVLALLISGAMLVAVAIKLDKRTSTPATKTVTVTKSTPAAGTPAAPAAATLPSTSDEILTEMKITGSASTVAAGKVTFNVKNAGKVTHEFVVLDTPTPAGKIPTDAKGRADESKNIGETGDVKVGASKTLTLNLKPGHYALICNLPGHYTGGMYADLTVK